MRNGATMTNLESYLKKRGITEKQMEEARGQTEAPQVMTRAARHIKK